MKIFKILCLISVFTLSIFSSAAVQANEKTSPPILSVDGSGSYEAAPDTASITIGISTFSTEAENAQTQNASIASNIQNALTALGIAEKNIQTRNYNFRPTYNTEKGHENEYSGYAVDNTIYVVVDDVSLVGNVVDTALSNGANRINSLNFSVRNPQKIRKFALLAAVKDARDKADIIAEGLGKHIIGVQNVSENSSIPTHRYDTALFAKAAANSETSIAAGNLECSATVHIEFILSD